MYSSSLFAISYFNPLSLFTTLAYTFPYATVFLYLTLNVDVLVKHFTSVIVIFGSIFPFASREEHTCPPIGQGGRCLNVKRTTYLVLKDAFRWTPYSLILQNLLTINFTIVKKSFLTSRFHYPLTLCFFMCIRLSNIKGGCSQ